MILINIFDIQRFVVLDVTVVVHLYDKSISSCVNLNLILEDLAKKEFLHVKFICMDVDEANVVVDRIALPLLQFYKRGNFLALTKTQNLGSLIFLNCRRSHTYNRCRSC